MIGSKITSTLSAPFRLAFSVAALVHGGESARRAEINLQTAIERRERHHQYVAKRLNDIPPSTQLAVDPTAA